MTRAVALSRACQLRRDLATVEGWLDAVDPETAEMRAIALAVDSRDAALDELLGLYDEHDGLCEETSWDDGWLGDGSTSSRVSADLFSRIRGGGSDA